MALSDTVWGRHPLRGRGLPGRAKQAWRTGAVVFAAAFGFAACGEQPDKAAHAAAAAAPVAGDGGAGLADHVASRVQIERLMGPLGAAEPAVAPRPLNASGFAVIRHFEGWSAAHYNDPSGYCTIGYGHLIALTVCAKTSLGEFANPLTKKAGEALLEQDSRAARRAVLRGVKVELSDDEFAALTSFVFNVGAKEFESSTLLRLVNNGRHDLAAQQFGRWIWSKGKPHNGLVNRRKCESALFKGVLALKADGRIDQARCDALGVAPAAGPPIDIDVGEVP